MNVLVNGGEASVEDDATVLDLLRSHSLVASEEGVAVVVNDAVVPRARWGETPLAPDDRVEILRAAAGG